MRFCSRSRHRCCFVCGKHNTNAPETTPRPQQSTSNANVSFASTAANASDPSAVSKPAESQEGKAGVEGATAQQELDTRYREARDAHKDDIALYIAFSAGFDRAHRTFKRPAC